MAPLGSPLTFLGYKSCGYCQQLVKMLSIAPGAQHSVCAQQKASQALGKSVGVPRETSYPNQDLAT